MAAEEGAVIACHTKDEFDARMAKAKEEGKLVRTRPTRAAIIAISCTSCSCDTNACIFCNNSTAASNKANILSTICLPITGRRRQVVIDFMAPWCSGCQMMAPVYADCASKYPSAVFLEVDVDELLVSQYNERMHARRRSVSVVVVVVVLTTSTCAAVNLLCSILHVRTYVQEVAKIYGVNVMPTFCFIRNGETLESFATVDEGELRDAVRKYAAAAAGTTTAPASASA